MNAGTRQHLVEIQRSTSSVDELGTPIKTWVKHQKVWCKISPIGADEMMRSKQLVSEASHLAEMRYVEDLITSADRIKYGNRYFGVISVIDKGEKRIKLDVACREMVE